MRFNSLDDWLRWQEGLSPVEIDLGLDRVAKVLANAGLKSRFDCPLITVAGTNGKGSVVAMLEAIAVAAGLKVASYTSPHLLRYNERIRIDTVAVSDDELCEAFERIDRARGDIALTYFEFGTLAAISLFSRAQADLVILEVGLGGRLDAVNVMDADVSVLTSVDIDHTDWLGDDREAIGHEKAGVFRAGQTVICAEAEPPRTVTQHATRLTCRFLRPGRDFSVTIKADGYWSLQGPYGAYPELPRPALAGEFQYGNAAAAILALQALADSQRLPALRQADVAGAMARVCLPGRFQQISRHPAVYVDVAHNRQAASALAGILAASAGGQKKTLAVVAMLADKDVAGVLEIIAPCIDQWCFAGLPQVDRGLSVTALADRVPASILPLEYRPVAHDFEQNPCKMREQGLLFCRDVETACERLDRLHGRQHGSDTRIVVFGSFYTVSAAMRYFQAHNRQQTDSFESEVED